ncbi:putative signal peptide protein [Puccinia sorghi]|uniref:Putative signal peptide protein n=1 Tax=Puccinia sorghi TaxID=27349 RepID=A0A0L6URD1_9BASI|nr:putative signal peptide protein [Puccinia sorghi]
MSLFLTCIFLIHVDQSPCPQIDHLVSPFTLN